jgi:multisubunit Na+/H+ antiporter MnhB subunit
MVYLVVVGSSVVGLAIVALGAWRPGVAVIGAALLVGAGARALLRDRDAGMLRVRRHRWVDVLMLGCVGTALLVLASVIPNQPGS